MTHSRPLLRALLRKVLRTDSDLDAFCGDYFPKVRTRFTGGMDQIAKVTMLLDHAKPVSIVEALEEAHPESVRDFEREQRARPQSYSELAELDKVRDGAEAPGATATPFPAPPGMTAPPFQAPGATATPFPAPPGMTAPPFQAPYAPAAPAKQDRMPRRTLLAVTIGGVLVVGISGLTLAMILSSSSETEPTGGVATRAVSAPTDAVDNTDAAARTGTRGPSTAKPPSTSPPVGTTSSPPTAPVTAATPPVEIRDAGVGVHDSGAAHDAGARDAGNIIIKCKFPPCIIVPPKRPDGG